MNQALTCFRRKTHKRVLAVLAIWSLLSALPVPVLALPQGGSVGGGNVSWQTVGNKMTVNQGSNRAIINWDTFGIGAHETVQFVQPGANAAILNRVTGRYSSEIFGSLLANGNVYLVNPNGILFGAGSRINVGGLVASTFDLSDEDFNAGRLNFARMLNSGQVINHGTITAGAFTYLLGAGVENDGVIRAPAVALAAGREKIVIDRTENGGEIRLSVDPGMPAISFDVSVDPAAMPNVINQGVVDVSGETGGQAVLQGANVVQAGTVRADGTEGDGGRISLLGERLIALGSESVTTANAGLDGDGGRIEVIAENFAGIYDGAQIAARGGSLRGDGGFVETSGHRSFVIDAVPDVGAVNGQAGEWLIDPYNIEIVSDSGFGYNNATPGLIFSTVDNTLVPVSIILAALADGNVTVRTQTDGMQDGTITVSAAITYLGSNTLTLEAVQDILINAIIQAEDGGLGLIAGGSVTQAAAADLLLGTLTLDVTGNVTLENAGNRIGTLGGTVGGTLELRNNVDLNLNGLTVENDQTVLNVNGNLTGNDANILADLTVTAAGDITLNNADNDFGYVAASANGGAGAIKLADKNGLTLRDIKGGSLTVTALGGDIVQEDGTTVDVADATDLDATGQIVLFNEGNQFGGPVDAAATLVKLRAADGIELNEVDAGMDGLTVRTDGGAITQTATGSVSVDGETRLTARSGADPAAISLDNDANDFVGAVHADGLDITLADGNSILLGDIDAAGTLAVTARGGSVTQADETRVDVAGVASFLAEGTGNDIVLTSVLNDFQDTVNAYGRDIALTDGNGGLSVGRIKGKADPDDGTAAGTVVVTALNGGGITDAQGETVSHDAEGFAVQNGARTVNIIADNLLLDAVGDIGGDGAPLDIEAGTLAARSSDGNVWLYETDALTIGTVNGVAGVSAAANAKVETLEGSITVAQAVTATGGDILLAAQGTGADVSVQAAVGADGNVTLLAANGVLQGAAGDLTAGASIDVEAKDGSVIMTDGASAAANGNIRYFAAQHAAITGLDGANVRVEAAAGSITDAGDTRADVTAATAQLVAGGSVGGAGGTESDDNTLALDTAVASLAARAGTDGSIHVRNTGTLTIGTVDAINVNRVVLDGSAAPLAGAALAGAEAGEDLKIVNGTGDLTVNESVTAVNGDVLLLAQDGALAQQAVLTAGGLATLMASGALEIHADIAAGGDVTIEAAGGNLTQAAGTGVSGANIRLASSGDVALGSLTADDAVSVVAGGNITDADANEMANITASRARLEAGGSIGAGAGAESDANLAAVDLAVGNIEASAVVDLYLQSLNAMTVGGVGDVGIYRARFDSGVTSVTDADLTGLSADTGVAKVKAAGALTAAEAVAAGTDALILTTDGDIILNAGLTAGGGAAAVAAQNVAQNADITAGGDLYVEAVGGSVTMADGTVSSAGGHARVAAAQDVALGAVAAAGDASVLAAAGDITDNTADETANVTAQGLRLEAGGSIGSGAGAESDANAAALNTSAVKIEAQAGQNIYLDELNAVTVGGVDGVSVGMVRFGSGTTAVSDGDLAGINAVAGAAKLKAGGTATAAEAVAAGTDALILTTAGDIVLNAGLTAGGGAAAVAAQNVAQNAGIAAGGDLYVEAVGGSVTMADGTVSSAGGNARVAAAQDVALAALVATGDASVLAVAGDITDNTADETANVTAQGLRLEAGGSVGSGAGAESDANAALNTSAARIEAQAGQNIYIDESDGVTVGGVDGVSVGMVRFGSGTTAVSDGGLAGINAVAGAAKLKAGGTATVAETFTAGTDALVLTTAGDIVLNAGLTAGGHATVIAAAGVAQNADIAAGGGLYVEAVGGSVTMADGTVSSAGGNARVAAAQDVALGAVAAAGDASVLAVAGDITDNTAAETANVTAQGLRLEAGGSIGSGAGAESDANAAALNTAAANLEAQAGQNIYIDESDGVTVGGVDGVSVGMVRFGSGTTAVSDGDLAGINAVAGAAKLKAGGTATVAETFAAGTDALVLTTDGDIVLNAGLTAGGGAAAVAAQNVAQNADIAAGGDVTLEAAGGDVTQAAGAAVNGASIRLAASGDVALGKLTADDAVSVVAGGDITDADADESANIMASRARLEAGGSIGTAVNVVNTAVDIEAGHVEAVAGGDMHLRSQGTITVGGVGDVAVRRARFASGVSTSTDADLPGITAGGDFTAVSLNGSIVQTPDSVVTVGGDTVLTALHGDILLENALNDFGGQTDATARNVGLRDANDLLVGRVEATGGGHVRLTAGGSLLGNGMSPNVVAGTAELYAGLDIGAPLYLDVGRIDEARAGRDIHLIEVSGDMRVLRQVYAGRNLYLDVLHGGIVDADGDGYVRPRNVTQNNADLYAGWGMFLTADFVGSRGEPVELIARGSLYLDSHLPDASRGTGRYVWVVINGEVGNGPEDVLVGRHGASVPGMVIYNGQVVSGPWWVVRQFQLAQRSLFNRDQANLLDSGIIRVPWFLSPEVSLLSRDAVRDDLRDPEVKRVTGLEEEPGAEDGEDGVVIGIPVAKIP